MQHSAKKPNAEHKVLKILEDIWKVSKGHTPKHVTSVRESSETVCNIVAVRIKPSTIPGPEVLRTTRLISP